MRFVYLLLSLFLSSNGLTINKQQNKQIVTLGPSCKSYCTLKQLHDKGANIFRINMSHNTIESAKIWIAALNNLRDEINTTTPLEIMVDIQGPKYRIGKIKNDECYIRENSRLVLDKNDRPGNNERVYLPNNNIFYSIKKNDKILIDDGAIELRVVSREWYGSHKLITDVVRGGVLKSNKGLNVPYVDIEYEITEKDKQDIEMVNELNVDWVALSFVQTHLDVVKISKLIKKPIKIMSKIECPKAVDNLNEIVDVSDGILIARGDLGLELGIEKVPFVQKLAIKKAVSKSCDVIVATQMLESMINSKVPTRAEVSDIANAILDGATGVMLSTETSVGKYPLECVKIQRKIMDETTKFTSPL